MRPNLTFEQLQRWSSGIASAVSATLPEEISAHFTAGARDLIASDQVYIGLYLRDSASITIYERDPDHWNHNYDTRKYQQDPFFRRFVGSKQDFLLPLSALDKGDFHTSAYYRDFYEPSGSFDEITGVFNFDRNAAGFVTYLRRRGARPFGAEDVAMAEATAEATRLVLERLWRQWRPAGGSPLSLGELSTRERQIALLLIDGGCAKTISRDLSISPGTVRNHIKTVYRKLGIHSQVELMAAARDGGRAPLSLP
ncbi:LuxR C-terminal-related transcriptional regulator [Shinella curvata]|uniref:LuxR C-terminal-related transcriptional regulator n=1 Tax=Shinella curvata TaxID=1817964 RepID=A0ABT8XAD3_9HYPH|nr:LuxR C-terminal-related transcriptional regulator [Shinella curvata]MCJ8054903.1 LuxR C-terminal-related transcriptional regulator [Shinella curvata]MDO6120701.1 LuxR C-terminal-related transcriptional regulator [Shinella curvata]